MGILTNEQLAERIQRGERNLIKELYQNVKGYIFKTATGISGCRKKITAEDPASSPEELLCEDLCQQSFFALNRAVNEWDRESCEVFIIFFSTVLKRELWSYAADCGHTIRIPQPYRAALYKYEKALHRFKAEHGTDPTPEDMARILGVSADQARQLRDDLRLLQCGSLDAPAGEDDEATVLDLQPAEDDRISDTVDRIQQEELGAALWPIIDTLPGKHQPEILRLRFQDNLTYDEIADRLAISRARAEQCCKAAYKKLRTDKFIEQLRPYTDEAAEILGYRNTGLSAFQRTGSSSVECAVMKLNDYRMKFARADYKKQDKTI